MLAVQRFGGDGLDALQVTDIEQPTSPNAGELLVRVRASSLNYLDYLVASGIVATRPGHIPLVDGAGEVVAVGDDVREFAVGDTVIGTFFPDWVSGKPDPLYTARASGVTIDGFACEYVCKPATAFTKAPGKFSVEQAATLGCAALTAWKGLVVDGGVKPGDVVLTQGTGGVSLFALQFAKMAGATVIATSSSDEKLDKLTQLGADHVINYREDPKWGKSAKALTDGRGVDHVMDVGGATTLRHSINACAREGKIALIGVLSGDKAEISPATLFSNLIQIRGVKVGSREHQQDMVRALNANPQITPVIDKSFPVHCIVDAFKHQESQQQFGKITVVI